MKVHIITLFPEFFTFPLKVGPMAKAIEVGSLKVELIDIRKYADSPKEVDDYPYGGRAGMVLKPEPVVRAIESVKTDKSTVILMSAQGKTLTHKLVKELTSLKHMIIVCGRYKGIDERIMNWVDFEISIGDYVLSGGEPAALVILDAVSRWLPGALGDRDSAETDSFETGILDAPVYTRPRVFRGLKVPEILLSGNHQAIRRWERKEALKRTLLKRPDLLNRADLSDEDKRLLEEIKKELKESL